MVRAYTLDQEAMKRVIVEKYDQPTETKKAILDWYESLVDMMRREDVAEQGHLQLNKNVIIDLTDLHLRLMKSTKEPFYSAEFYKTLPFIVELRSKAKENIKGEIETCFDALYGVLMLRLQGKEISPETQRAISQISRFLALLSEKYKQDRNNELEL
mgnify:FL=1